MFINDYQEQWRQFAQQCSMAASRMEQCSEASVILGIRATDLFAEPSTAIATASAVWSDDISGFIHPFIDGDAVVYDVTNKDGRLITSVRRDHQSETDDNEDEAVATVEDAYALATQKGFQTYSTLESLATAGMSKEELTASEISSLFSSGYYSIPDEMVALRDTLNLAAIRSGGALPSATLFSIIQDYLRQSSRVTESSFEKDNNVAFPTTAMWAYAVDIGQALLPALFSIVGSIINPVLGVLAGVVIGATATAVQAVSTYGSWKASSAPLSDIFDGVLFSTQLHPISARYIDGPTRGNFLTINGGPVTTYVGGNYASENIDLTTPYTINGYIHIAVHPARLLEFLGKVMRCPERGSSTKAPYFNKGVSNLPDFEALQITQEEWNREFVGNPQSMRRAFISSFMYAIMLYGFDATWAYKGETSSFYGYNDLDSNGYPYWGAINSARFAVPAGGAVSDILGLIMYTLIQGRFFNMDSQYAVSGEDVQSWYSLLDAIDDENIANAYHIVRTSTSQSDLLQAFATDNSNYPSGIETVPVSTGYIQIGGAHRSLVRSFATVVPDAVTPLITFRASTSYPNDQWAAPCSPALQAPEFPVWKAVDFILTAAAVTAVSALAIRKINMRLRLNRMVKSQVAMNNLAYKRTQFLENPTKETAKAYAKQVQKYNRFAARCGTAAYDIDTGLLSVSPTISPSNTGFVSTSTLGSLSENVASIRQAIGADVDGGVDDLLRIFTNIVVPSQS